MSTEMLTPRPPSDSYQRPKNIRPAPRPSARDYLMSASGPSGRQRPEGVPPTPSPGGSGAMRRPQSVRVNPAAKRTDTKIVPSLSAQIRKPPQSAAGPYCISCSTALSRDALYKGEAELVGTHPVCRACVEKRQRAVTARKHRQLLAASVAATALVLGILLPQALAWVLFLSGASLAAVGLFGAGVGQHPSLPIAAAGMLLACSSLGAAFWIDSARVTKTEVKAEARELADVQNLLQQNAYARAHERFLMLQARLQKALTQGQSAPALQQSVDQLNALLQNWLREHLAADTPQAQRAAEVLLASFPDSAERLRALYFKDGLLRVTLRAPTTASSASNSARPDSVKISAGPASAAGKPQIERSPAAPDDLTAEVRSYAVILFSELAEVQDLEFVLVDAADQETQRLGAGRARELHLINPNNQEK